MSTASYGKTLREQGVSLFSHSFERWRLGSCTRHLEDDGPYTLRTSESSVPSRRVRRTFNTDRRHLIRVCNSEFASRLTISGLNAIGTLSTKLNRRSITLLIYMHYVRIYAETTVWPLVVCVPVAEYPCAASAYRGEAAASRGMSATVMPQRLGRSS